MSETTVKPQAADQSEEAKVIDYLQKNPELLMAYPKIFSELSIPHQTGGATSLLERQLKLLREDNKKPKKIFGYAINNSGFFPQRVNVGFMQRLDRGAFKLRVFERGVGETKACGSGACAAMVAGHRLGLLDNQAEAYLLGGVLNLEWQGDENPVMMTGETTMVFEGAISDE